MEKLKILLIINNVPTLRMSVYLAHISKFLSNIITLCPILSIFKKNSEVTYLDFFVKNNVTKNYEAKTRNCDCVNVHCCTLGGHIYLLLEPYSYGICHCYHVSFIRTYECIIFNGEPKAKKLNGDLIICQNNKFFE